jgi:hypothetical protein
LVNWNSETSGIATDQTPERSIARAMIPGRSMPLYSGRIRPLVVMTFPKTNTSSIGWKSVWSSSVTKLRRAT